LTNLGFDPENEEDCQLIHAMLDEYLSYLRTMKAKHPDGWEGEDDDNNGFTINRFIIWDGMHRD